jgi:hypothetical protein
MDTGALRFLLEVANKTQLFDESKKIIGNQLEPEISMVFRGKSPEVARLKDAFTNGYLVALSNFDPLLIKIHLTGDKLTIQVPQEALTIIRDQLSNQ